jgi:hypothetical protein
MKKVLVLILFIFLPVLGYAQIVIEERVEISPEGINNIQPFGSISGDDRNPVYLGYGGEVTLRLIHSIHNSYQLWEETLGQLTISGTTSIGTFPQWHKFIFYLLDPATGNKYYPQPGDDIVWDWGSTIDFYPSHQPGDPYPYNPEDWWEIDVDVNNAFAAIPPEEILNYLGNPFVPSQPLVVPVDGNLYAFVTRVVNKNNTPTDEVWMDIPETQLLLDDIGSHLYDMYDLGHMMAGDPIRFFLRTQNSLVSGMNLYPEQIREETFLPDGNILLWRLQFEDWTDLRFDDVEIEIYFTPDSIGSFPGPIAITIEPPVIAPGDTAEIIIQKRYLDGTLEDFTQWRSFEIGMIDGCDAGLLLSDGILEPYFENVYQPVYFVADSNVTERDTVVIRAGLIEYFGGRPIFNDGDPNDTEADIELKTRLNDKRNLAIKKSGKNIKEPEPLPMNPTTYCFIGEIDWSSVGDGSVVVGDEEIEIMLGETKYFQAKGNTETNKLKIEEIKPDANGVPQQKTGTEDGWEWLTSDVWGNNSISVVECDTCGKKMGVYWEKKYPKWGSYRYDKNHDEYYGRDFNGMATLSNGLIRVIGRYWHKDSTYIVNLKAKTNTEDSVLTEIRVIKPSELVSEEEAATRFGSYSKTKDVFGHPVNIDSICIYYGGILGVSPQLLKGQMHKETAKTNFSGNIGWGFAPTYRYEPYTTQQKEQVCKTLTTNPYYITPTTIVSPPNHQFTKPMQYFSGDTMTVWQIVNEYSQLVNKNNSDLYGYRTDKDTMNYGNYSTVQKKYHSYFLETEKIEIIGADGIKRKLTFAERADSTNKKMIAYLRDEFIFEDVNNTKGMINMIAQTRIASSYGLFQAMYTTAIGEKWNYPQDADHKPEALNEIDTNLVYVSKRQARYLSSYDNKNKWEDGYEETIRKILFKKWNGDDYSKYAIKRSQLFTPKK